MMYPGYKPKSLSLWSYDVKHLVGKQKSFQEIISMKIYSGLYSFETFIYNCAIHTY